MNRIEFGDCIDGLRSFPAGVAHTCVTSPPYYGLRDYGVDGQIGLERTPGEYVAKLVEVFREVRRVLRDDGTVWLNLGDSYAGSGRDGNPGGSSTLEGGQASQDASMVKRTRNDVSQRDAATTAKGDRLRGLVGDKQLLGIPWRVAFALQDDGWVLRQEIIWNKTNPTPESVTDRCTKAHEHLFLLSKRPRYYFDRVAMQEPVVSGPSDLRKMREQKPRIGGRHKDATDRLLAANAASNLGQKRAVGNGNTRNRRSVWTVSTKPYKGAHFATFPPDLIEPCVLAGSPTGGLVLDPFMGSGTTAMVAAKHGRQFLGCELNPAYRSLQDARLAAVLVEDLL